MPRAKRREREIERTREDILAAAARVFARAGYRGATMQDIAREAGYTAPSLYSYFRGKEAIVEGLIDLVVGEVLSLLDEPLPRGLTLEQRLEFLVRRLLEVAERRRDAITLFFRFMTAREPLPNEEGPPAHTNAVDLLIDRLTDWFSVSEDSEELGECTPREAAYFLFGTLWAFFLRSTTSEDGPPLQEQLLPLLSLFLHGIRGRRDHGAGKMGDTP